MPIKKSPVSNSDLIQGVYESAFSMKNEFVGGTTSTLVRNRGMTANAGVGATPVTNDYDTAPIYSEMQDVTDSYGNVFVRIPRFYIKKTPTATGMIRQISKRPMAGGYLPWCFWDFTNNIELPYVDIGKYNASLSADGTKLESKPNTYPLVIRHIVDFRALAMANGKGYQQLDIHMIDVLTTLFYIEFGTVNSDEIARGWTAGNYSTGDVATVAETGANRIIVANATADKYAVGEPITIGTAQGSGNIAADREITAIEDYDGDNKAIVFDGTAADIAVGNVLQNSGWKSGFSSTIAASSGSHNNLTNGKNPFVYRGIENPWGSIWQFVDGINISDNQSWVCKDATKYASNVFASPYEKLSYVNADANNYLVKMGFDENYPFAEIPVEVGAISESAYKDYYYQAAGERIARFGGSWASGADAGLSTWTLADASSRSTLALGGRACYKPL